MVGWFTEINWLWDLCQIKTLLKPYKSICQFLSEMEYCSYLTMEEMILPPDKGRTEGLRWTTYGHHCIEKVVSISISNLNYLSLEQWHSVTGIFLAYWKL